MFKQSVTIAHKSPEPPLTDPRGLPDPEPAKQLPLPEPPYKPYAEKTAVHEPAYEPYKDI